MPGVWDIVSARATPPRGALDPPMLRRVAPNTCGRPPHAIMGAGARVYTSFLAVPRATYAAEGEPLELSAPVSLGAEEMDT